jgi:hypothetical protein
MRRPHRGLVANIDLSIFPVLLRSSWQASSPSCWFTTTSSLTRGRKKRQETGFWSDSQGGESFRDESGQSLTSLLPCFDLRRHFMLSIAFLFFFIGVRITSAIRSFISLTNTVFVATDPSVGIFSDRALELFRRNLLQVGILISCSQLILMLSCSAW